MSTDAKTGGSANSAGSAKSVAWRTNLWLFLATAASVFLTGVASSPHEGLFSAAALLDGAQFAGSLLTILVAHELGHYIAARIHGVDASLPYFIPMPLVSPFGTMGAVIRMRGTIPTRRALLDIGASGPLAGLVFAIPLYAWGVAHSQLIPISTGSFIDLGESILIKGLDRAFAPAVPDGMLLVYSPVAFGAWGGFFVTMINLLPVGQLDGGHVAYALFGPKQDRYATLAHRALLAFFCVIIVGHLGRDLAGGRGVSVVSLGRHISNAVFWLVWFQVLAVLGSLAGRGETSRRSREGEHEQGVLTIRTRAIATGGLLILAILARSNASWLIVGAFFGGLAILVAMEVKGGVLREHDLLEHPPTGAEPLDIGRRLVAIVTLVLFALLFMPEPFSL